jgi:hypothetical protein
MVQVASFILDRISQQMTAIGAMRKEGIDPSKADLTDSLLIAKADLAKKFGDDRTGAFVSKFATPITDANATFMSPFVVNQVYLAPLIDLGEHLYAPNSYRLIESIYESPFYWMMLDDSYRDTAATHRGAFLERTAAALFAPCSAKPTSMRM